MLLNLLFWLPHSKVLTTHQSNDDEINLEKTSFFSVWVFFHEHSLFTGQQGGGGGYFFNPLYHFHLLHRHFDISRVITAESSPLHVAAGLELETFGFWAQVANH